ncbi:SMP-30/gluconolactonase/LRE family protein [Mesorhizobium sp. LHD-90]|uniref:SMP-30/gluconolactonase/LRE family protein n=1 Tax=Mesorhizobium sp. LHD-90 TaxID=3071414 RepID=UPI0027E1E524|nr:SMP-30/gluconolactonase/LRE family protein [Mesorhizobium sp. LHD-90]MDQ6436971.1 SMP-30/gluconolactonase/LRE family protein [Mesorhizobium sp. LHD-90]
MTMFPLPQTIEAEVFSEVPESLHWKGEPTPWLKGRPWGKPGSFLEGPGFDKEGNLLCVDIPYGRIFRVSPNGEFELFVQYDGEPNGLRIHRDGRIFIADHKRGIVVIDPISRKVEPFLEKIGGRPLVGPNDLVFTNEGNIYFTDMGDSDLAEPDGRLVHLTAEGHATVVLDDLAAPNGLALNGAGTTLYLNMFRENAVWQMRLREDGSVTRVSRFLQLSGGLGPDGLLLDGADNLLVVHGGLGCVWVFNPLGEPLQRVVSPRGKMTTNVAFGISDPRRIYITDSTTGTLLTARLPVAGRMPFSHSHS